MYAKILSSIKFIYNKINFTDFANALIFFIIKKQRQAI